MKSFVRFFIFIIVISTTQAQAQMSKHVTLYGFKQPVVSGAPPKVRYNEGGQETTTAKSSKANYLIYVAGPAGTRLYPVEIWLNGKLYGAKATPLKKTPIQYSNANSPGAEPMTLVPKTVKAVWQLNTVTETAPKKLAIAKTKAQSNELVLVYKMAGKFYYALVKKLTVLEAAYMQ